MSNERKPRIGVIFLPGILGSPLTDDTSQRAWPVHEFQDSETLAIYFASLSLTEKIERFTKYDGQPGVISHRTRVLKASVGGNGECQHVATFYRDFVRALRLKTAPFADLPFDIDIVVMNYNWTNTINTSATKVFMDTRATAAGYDGFMYVTHSMGGIVAMKAIISIDQDSGLRKKFLGAVRVACPVTGAPETVARLRRGIPYQFEWGNWDTWTTEYIAERLVAQMLGVTGWEFSLLAAHIPGLSSLLPGAKDGINLHTIRSIVGKHFAKDAEPPKSTSGRARAAWEYGRDHLEHILKLTESYWGAADKIRSEIDGAREELWEEFVCAVALTGKETTLAVDQDGQPTETGKYGDGTVPDDVQYCLSDLASVKFVHDGIDHADAFSDQKTWPQIKEAMMVLFKKWEARRGQ